MSERAENGYIALVVGCFCLLAIIGLVSWTVPYSKGYQAADKDHQAAYAEHDAAEQYYIKCKSEATVVEALKCYQETEQRDRDQQTSEQDLDAQREMANWAEGMLWAAIIIGCFTFSITALGVYWVRDTLRATKDAVLAANDANQIMRDEQRPWVTLEKEALCEFYDVGGFQGLIAWNHNLINKGKSPAYAVRSHSKIVKGDDFMIACWQIEEFANACFAKHNTGGVPIIFPGEKTDFVKYSHFHSNSYDMSRNRNGVLEKNVVQGDYVGFLFCVTYRTGLSEDSLIGLEARVFGIEEIQGFAGPWRHKLREFYSARIVR